MLRKTDIDLIQKNLAEVDVARDGVFETSRTAVRFSGRAIVELHRGNAEKAAEYIANAEGALKELENNLKKRKELASLGTVIVA